MKKIFSISCLLLFAAFSLVACKEDDPEQTKVTLEPERVTVTVGETAQLTVHVSPASAAGAGVYGARRTSRWPPWPTDWSQASASVRRA